LIVAKLSELVSNSNILLPPICRFIQFVFLAALPAIRFYSKNAPKKFFIFVDTFSSSDFFGFCLGCFGASSS
ncbi:putative ATPase n2B, partial [Listeria innocua FSL S4-378]